MLIHNNFKNKFKPITGKIVIYSGAYNFRLKFQKDNYFEVTK